MENTRGDRSNDPEEARLPLPRLAPAKTATAPVTAIATPQYLPMPVHTDRLLQTTPFSEFFERAVCRTGLRWQAKCLSLLEAEGPWVARRCGSLYRLYRATTRCVIL